MAAMRFSFARLGTLVAVLLAFLSANAPAQQKDNEKWIPLFNGKDLTGWTVKLTKHDVGVNFNDTFRVEDGVLKVSYDKWKSFDGQFGHLYTKEKYSHYRLRVEYRFIGKQCPGGPSWALRNSGAMLHAQSPESMRKDQEFPVSVELQYLGGDGKNKRPTANMCSPGTHVVMNGKPLRILGNDAFRPSVRPRVRSSMKEHQLPPSLPPRAYGEPPQKRP